MYNTYRMMLGNTNDTYLNKTLEELVEEYKEADKQDKVLKMNKIVAAMFCKVFPMILKIQERYYSITNEQKVDTAVYHLVRSIKRYKNKNVKFSSFYYTHLSNMMKSLLTAETSLKRVVWYNIVNNNEDVMKWYAKNAPTKEPEMSNDYFLKNLESSTYLSTEEKEYCRMILDGYNKSKEINDQFTQRNINLIYDNKNSKITNPLENKTPEELLKYQAQMEKKQLKRVRDIRDSIKQKHKQYGDIIFG